MPYRSLICFVVLLYSCKERPNSNTGFRLISSQESGLKFINDLTETAQFNIIEYLYFYNGGGVAIGDINNDGLSDIYLSSNQGSNKLFLNKGNLKFEDITSKSGVAGFGNWKTGVTMVDINADGLLDIYLCGVGNYKAFNGYNQLYINNGDLTFSEKAKEYGLYFKGFSTNTAFFDYDLDGDLDMYLVNHSVHTQRSYGKASMRFDIDSLSGDRLFKNLAVETGATHFIDNTVESGILSSHIGYGLGVGISDVDKDGYPDIYVSNDFAENDYLYINQKNGKFKLQAMDHTSRFSMGNDIADINNDQRPDIFTTDMLPKKEEIIKTTSGEDNYDIYKFKLEYGYGRQVSRNTLQINQGLDDFNNVTFSDVALFADVAASDWSWAPLIFDFDNDGLNDIFISNGILRRPNDLDYISYISTEHSQKLMEKDALPFISKMPSGKVANCFYRNTDSLKFVDLAGDWKLDAPTFSNGAAYGDLDNDGDLDLVVNNTNESVFLYRNNAAAKSVSIELIGDTTSWNPMAIGAKVILYKGANTYYKELFLTRGWCSSSDAKIIFGLGKSDNYDSVTVIWPNGQMKSVDSKTKDHQLKIFYSKGDRRSESPSLASRKALVKRVDYGLSFKHNENDFDAFNFEKLIPYLYTTEGPRMAVADFNADGLDDFFVCGSKNQSSELFIQSTNSSFTKKKIASVKKDSLWEDIDACFKDFNQDGNLDLIVVSGGQELNTGSVRLYLNNGKGDFDDSRLIFHDPFFNASTIKPADYDNDGDFDFFVGSNVIPGNYGVSPVSYLFENDGAGNFTPKLNWLRGCAFNNFPFENIGMVKDALWVDINRDSLVDLVVVGDWMPITILVQDKNHFFSNETQAYGLGETSGLWNRIETADIDRDGDADFVVGNWGANTRLKFDDSTPLKLYFNDYDQNESLDHLLVYSNDGLQSLFFSRDLLLKQVPAFKRKFPTYSKYGKVDIESILSPEQINQSKKLMATMMQSVVLTNHSTSFKINPLPPEAQYFPVKAICFSDINNDGSNDILLGGNLLAIQPEIGVSDAGHGLMLVGDGRGQFRTCLPEVAGFNVTGEVRDIAIVKGYKGESLYLVSRNNNTILTYRKQ